MNPDITAPCQTTLNTGMAWSVLAEVQTLLARLASAGETAAVDVRGLPLTAADRDELETLLGRGEVACKLTLLGRTEIWETAYAGVWWVRHFGGQDQISSETLEITTVPEILKAHPVDISEAVSRLKRQLEGGPGPADNQASEEAEHD